MSALEQIDSSGWSVGVDDQGRGKFEVHVFVPPDLARALEVLPLEVRMELVEDVAPWLEAVVRKAEGDLVRRLEVIQGFAGLGQEDLGEREVPGDDRLVDEDPEPGAPPAARPDPDSGPSSSPAAAPDPDSPAAGEDLPGSDPGASSEGEESEELADDVLLALARWGPCTPSKVIDALGPSAGSKKGIRIRELVEKLGVPQGNVRGRQAYVHPDEAEQEEDPPGPPEPPAADAPTGGDQDHRAPLELPPADDPATIGRIVDHARAQAEKAKAEALGSRDTTDVDLVKADVLDVLHRRGPLTVREIVDVLGLADRGYSPHRLQGIFQRWGRVKTQKQDGGGRGIWEVVPLASEVAGVEISTGSTGPELGIQERILRSLRDQATATIPDLAQLLDEKPATIAHQVSLLQRHDPPLLAKSFSKYALTPAGEQVAADLSRAAA